MAPLWNGKTFAGRSLSTWIVQQGVPKNLKIQLLSHTSNRLEIFFSPRLRRSSTVPAVQRSTWLYDRVAMQCGKSCQLSYMHGTIVNRILHKSANNTQTKQPNTKPRITPIRPTPPFFSSTSMATVHDGSYRFHQSPLRTKHCQSATVVKGCSSDQWAKFRSKLLGCHELWAERPSVSEKWSEAMPWKDMETSNVQNEFTGRPTRWEGNARAMERELMASASGVKISGYVTWGDTKGQSGEGSRDRVLQSTFQPRKTAFIHNGSNTIVQLDAKFSGETRLNCQHARDWWGMATCSTVGLSETESSHARRSHAIELSAIQVVVAAAVNVNCFFAGCCLNATKVSRGSPFSQRGQRAVSDDQTNCKNIHVN